MGIGTGVRSSAAAALFDLARDNGAPVALRDIGMKENDLDRATDLVVSNPYWNPRGVGVAQRGEIRELLQKAFEGTRRSGETSRPSLIKSSPEHCSVFHWQWRELAEVMRAAEYVFRNRDAVSRAAP